jgi:hypothetical protein
MKSQYRLSVRLPTPGHRQNTFPSSRPMIAFKTLRSGTSGLYSVVVQRKRPKAGDLLTDQLKCLESRSFIPYGERQTRLRNPQMSLG